MPEDVKVSKIQEFLNHLNLVREERKLYSVMIAECCASLPPTFLDTTFAREQAKLLASLVKETTFSRRPIGVTGGEG